MPLPSFEQGRVDVEVTAGDDQSVDGVEDADARAVVYGKSTGSPLARSNASERTAA